MKYFKLALPGALLIVLWLGFLTLSVPAKAFDILCLVGCINQESRCNDECIKWSPTLVHVCLEDCNIRREQCVYECGGTN